MLALSSKLSPACPGQAVRGWAAGGLPWALLTGRDGAGTGQGQDGTLGLCQPGALGPVAAAPSLVVQQRGSWHNALGAHWYTSFFFFFPNSFEFFPTEGHG